MRRVHSMVLAVLIVLGFCSLAPGRDSDSSHPFSVRDMLAMDRISDPQVAPDGQWVVFVVRRTDLEANRGRSDLWLVSTAGAHLRRLTSHPESDANPRWAPDSRRIWFVWCWKRKGHRLHHGRIFGGPGPGAGSGLCPHCVDTFYASKSKEKKKQDKLARGNTPTTARHHGKRTQYFQGVGGRQPAVRTLLWL